MALLVRAYRLSPPALKGGLQLKAQRLSQTRKRNNRLIRSDKPAIRQINSKATRASGICSRLKNRSRYGNAMAAKMPNRIDFGHLTPTGVC